MGKLFSGLVGTWNPFLRTETEVGTERPGCGGQVHAALGATTASPCSALRADPGLPGGVSRGGLTLCEALGNPRGKSCQACERAKCHWEPKKSARSLDALQGFLREREQLVEGATGDALLGVFPALPCCASGEDAGRGPAPPSHPGPAESQAWCARHHRSASSG